MNVKKQRTWHYLEQPYDFDMSPCKCSNTRTQWSEYEGHLWCDVCGIDFIPDNNGIFDSPVPMKTSRFLGISFTKYNLVENLVEVLDEDDLYAKCFNINDCIDAGSIKVSIKNAKPEIVGQAVIDLNDFSVCIESLSDESEVLFSSSVYFGYPVTSKFNLLIRKIDNQFLFIENDDWRSFKSYILNESLMVSLSSDNELLSKKHKI